MLNNSHKCGILPEKTQKCQKMSLHARVMCIILVCHQKLKTFRMLDHRRKIKITPKDEVIVIDVKHACMLKAISRETGIPAEVLLLDAIARYAKGQPK